MKIADWKWRRSALLHQRTTFDSLLAVGAVVAAAPGDHDALDRRLADEAGLAFAAINAVLELEEACFAVGVDVVGDRRPSQGDRLFEHLFDRGMQLGKLFARDGCGSPARPDAGAE